MGFCADLVLEGRALVAGHELLVAQVVMQPGLVCEALAVRHSGETLQPLPPLRFFRRFIDLVVIVAFFGALGMNQAVESMLTSGADGACIQLEQCSNMICISARYLLSIGQHGDGV